MTQPVEQPRRGYARSTGGLVGALIAVTGLMVALWGLMWFQRSGTDDPARTVDYTAALAAAREQAPFHLVAPDPVPAGLRATSVSWDGVGGRVSWHLGFVTADGDYLGLYQGNGSVDEFVAANTPATRGGSVTTIGGARWRTLTDSGRGETALVRTVSGVTTVVTGTADAEELTVFAGSLR